MFFSFFNVSSYNMLVEICIKSKPERFQHRISITVKILESIFEKKTKQKTGEHASLEVRKLCEKP